MKFFKKMGMFICLLAITTLFSVTAEAKTEKSSTKSIVSTTTMLTDLTKNIVGDKYEVIGLMGVGVDPHLFKASAGDLTKLEKADVIIYGGLHLEGKLTEVFEKLTKSGKVVIDSSVGMSEDDLLPFELGGMGDPHIWFDVENWKTVATVISENIIKVDAANKDYYVERTNNYMKKLDALQEELDKKLAELPVEKRILVTAHDAFQYFAKANNFIVKGVQGISTESQAGTKDIKDLADFITAMKVKAIFIESSVPRKNIDALQEAVKSRGHNVVIGGELFSDSLGDASEGADTYEGMMKANMNTIVDALK